MLTTMKMIEKIERLLAARDMTQASLEQLVGLSVNRISKWKSGIGEPTARQALRIAEVFGVSVGWLISEDDHGNPVVADGLNEDERAVLDVFRALKLERHEAIRRLALTPVTSSDEERQQTARIRREIAAEFAEAMKLFKEEMSGDDLEKMLADEPEVGGKRSRQTIARLARLLIKEPVPHSEKGSAVAGDVSETLGVRDMTESFLARDRERKRQEREQLKAKERKKHGKGKADPKVS